MNLWSEDFRPKTITCASVRVKFNASRRGVVGSIGGQNRDVPVGRVAAERSTDSDRNYR